MLQQVIRNCNLQRKAISALGHSFKKDRSYQDKTIQEDMKEKAITGSTTTMTDDMTSLSRSMTSLSRWLIFSRS